MDTEKNQSRSDAMLEKLRLRLATVDRLPQLALLGTISGLLTGLVIIVFRILIEFTQAGLLPGDQAENFEALTPGMRLLLCTGGGLLIGLILHHLARDSRQVGVTHVMERLAYHQGRLPLRNAIWQFIGGALTIISGHSVGREGPCIHLGAASGSLLGQGLRLPNNSTRTLVACGVAAAIAASFNTPLAGVVFSMEVVMMEYTITGFMPVILSAVCATIVTRLVFGDTPAFSVPPLEMGSLQEMPFIVVMGVLIGCLAALYIHLLQYITERAAKHSLWLRATLAGLIVGLIAMITPQVMGVGYDTVNATLLGQVGLGLMLTIVVMKLFATSIALGLGLPGGLIGPALVIGAAAGGAMGMATDMLFPGNLSSHAFYAVIGMGAMMAAALQAPLAALMAMLELTSNPHIILPGMLAVITSGLTTSELFGKQSVFILLMKSRGLDYHNEPVAQSLRRISVANVMNREFIVCPKTMTATSIATLLDNKPLWLVINNGNELHSLLPAADLALYMQNQKEDDKAAAEINLQEIPAQRKQAASIHLQSTLQAALEKMTQAHVDMLCVTHSIRGEPRIDGILSRADIERHYLYQG